jgi:hypothetical protein
MTEDMTPPLRVRRPEGGRAGPRAMLVGLLLSPLAWILQMVVVETLSAQSCFPFSQPLSAPLVPWMRPALVAISALCLAAGVIGTLSAWRNLRRIGPAKSGALSGARRTRAELDRFLSRVAAMSSMLFLFALLATDVALAIVSPCKGW